MLIRQLALVLLLLTLPLFAIGAPPSILTAVEGKSSADALLLRFDEKAWQDLLDSKGTGAVTLPLPGRAEPVVLQLEPRLYKSAGPVTTFESFDGNRSFPIKVQQPESLRGVIEGEPGSSVLLVRTRDGLRGLINPGKGRSITIAPAGEDYPGLTQATNLSGAMPTVGEFCKALPAPGAGKSIARGKRLVGSPAPVEIAIEITYELYKFFDYDEVVAAEYAAALFEQVGLIYERDLDAELRLVHVRVWTTHRDPYSGDSGQHLTQIQGLVRDKRLPALSQNADLVHVLAQGVSRGGIAYIQAIDVCNGPGREYKTGFSDLSGSNSFPTSGWTWDVGVVAHELGHNFGSPHTHCYDPPLDRCYTEEDGCVTGTAVPQQGTIMSYCYLVASVRLEFSPQEIAVLREGMSYSPCIPGPVAISPDPPLRGEPVVIRYLPREGPLATEPSIYLYRGWNEWATVDPTVTPMVLNGGVWEATWSFPDVATEIDFAFNNNAGTWDNNDGRDWRYAVETGTDPAPPVYTDRVTITPDLPTRGTTATIVYNAQPGPINGASQISIHRGFDGWTRSVETLPMTRIGATQRWQATVALPADARSLEMAFNNGTGTWDNNGGDDWHFRTIAAPAGDPDGWMLY